MDQSEHQFIKEKKCRLLESIDEIRCMYHKLYVPHCNIDSDINELVYIHEILQHKVDEEIKRKFTLSGIQQ